MPWEITYKIPQTHTYLIGILYAVITTLQNIYTITIMADMHQIIHFTTNHAKTNILQYEDNRANPGAKLSRMNKYIIREKSQVVQQNMYILDKI
jgi:hypothetical protein